MATINLSSAVIAERLEAVPTLQADVSKSQATADNAVTAAGTAQSRADAAYSRADEAFTSVSNGKALLAAAITDKGVTTASEATFATMAANIASIPTGGEAKYIVKATTAATTETIDTSKNYVIMSFCFRSSSYFAMGVWTIDKGVLTAVKTGTGSTSYLQYITPTVSGSALTIPRAYNASYPSYYLIAEVE